jgi:hypothetical protein
MCWVQINNKKKRAVVVDGVAWHKEITVINFILINEATLTFSYSAPITTKHTTTTTTTNNY